MISWKKYVEEFSEDHITLKVDAPDIRFSYLQPSEFLLARDLMNRQIVDTQGMKLVRVNDLKLSKSGVQLRLLGAEVGVRGILRGLARPLEKLVVGVSKLVQHPLKEKIIAWNYMDLLDRDLSKVKLSVSHKRLGELHPADVADILEQLDPKQRSQVFRHLDEGHAIDTVSELEDEVQAEFVESLPDKQASRLLRKLDPDEAADIVRDLSYEKAETLLRLMGMKNSQEIRRLLGYKDGTAGGMMTPQYVSVREDATVQEATEKIRALDEDHPTIHCVYVVDDYDKLVGVLTLDKLVLYNGNRKIENIMKTDVISVKPEEEEDEVVDAIFKYDIPAMPVVDEAGVLLGIVTTEDAWDAIEDDVSPEKRKKFSLKILGIVVGGLLLLCLYSFVLLYIFNLIQ